MLSPKVRKPLLVEFKITKKRTLRHQHVDLNKKFNKNAIIEKRKLKMISYLAKSLNSAVHKKQHVHLSDLNLEDGAGMDKVGLDNFLRMCPHDKKKL